MARITAPRNFFLALPLLACEKEAPPQGATAAPSVMAEAAPAPAGNPPRVKVVDDEPGREGRYTLTVVPPKNLKVGEPGTVKIAVAPRDPWHVNLDYPTSLRLDAPAEIVLAKADLRKGDATRLDAGACEFAVELTAQKPGGRSVAGRLKFAVCQDEACVPVSEDLEFEVAAK
jgi:hypothetical protein